MKLTLQNFSWYIAQLILSLQGVELSDKNRDAQNKPVEIYDNEFFLYGGIWLVPVTTDCPYGHESQKFMKSPWKFMTASITWKYLSHCSSVVEHWSL